MRDNYPDLARVATMLLTFVQRLNEKRMIIDFSTVTDLLFERGRATGTWSTTDGKFNPIVMRRIETNGKRIWKIDSLIGKSILDPQFAVIDIPKEVMREGFSNCKTTTTVDEYRFENLENYDLNSNKLK